MEKTKLKINLNLTVNDFPIICRLCLSTEELKPIDQVDLFDFFKSIANIQIECNDNLPENICIRCMNQLEDISSFINFSKSNDLYLREILATVNAGSDSDTADDSHEFSDYKIAIKNENNISTTNEDENDMPVQTNSKKKTRPVQHSTKRQPSKCETCCERFDTKRKLMDHQKENSQCRTRQFKCLNCEKSFFTKLSLNIHIRSHTKETPFECKICFKKFRHSPNLKRHNDIVHKGLKPFKCELCAKEFATFLRITEHLRIHTGERPHICTYCGVSFKKYSTRYEHEMRHKIKNGEISESDKKPKKHPRRKPDDPSELECTTCKKIFSSKQALFVHTQSHIGDKSFLCTVCGKGFLRKSQLEVHIRIHTGEKPYKCSECGKHFSQAASLRNHLLIHKGKRSFKCDICQRAFIQLGHLQTHLKTHSGEKPYKCTFCGKGFAQNGSLKAHTRTHTGERPYRCSICCLEFYDSRTLKKHIKSHGVVKVIENESHGVVKVTENGYINQTS